MDKNKQAVAVFDKLASLYQEKFMDVTAYHQSLDFFCNHIEPEHASILEIACGPGNITKYILQQRPLLAFTCTDLAPNMVMLAKNNNPQAECKVMDCRHIAQLDKKYDAVLCGFCLPYLSMEETSQLIADMAVLLKPTGIIYISTIEAAHAASSYKKGSTGDEVFMHYYTGSFLTAALEKNGIEILHSERKEIVSDPATKDIIIVGKKLH